MDPVRIRLRNYRLFADEKPADFIVRQGFTAFVGPNNGGKSSILRMIYELRLIWQHLANPNGMIPLLRAPEEGGAFQVAMPALEDPTEIFYDRNTRDLEVDIEVLLGEQALSQTPPPLQRIVLVASRPPPNQAVMWRIRFQWPGGNKPPSFDTIVGDSVVYGNQRPVLDLGPILRCIRLFNNAFYVGPFRNVLSAQHDRYFDMLIGSTFVAAWNQWRNGLVKEENKITMKVIGDLQRIFELQDLDITATHDGRSLQIRVNSEPYKLREMGGGFSQFVVTLGNVAFARKDLLLIDEPELGLHPKLQLQFLTALSGYARAGTLFATHSIGLARSAAEHVYAVQSTPRGSAVADYSGITNLAEFAGEMNFSNYSALGIDKILLVEGVTEVKTVQQWLRLLGTEHRVVIIPMGGSQLARGGVEHELSELHRITKYVFALVDSERAAHGAPPQQERADFENLCKKLGIPVALTALRATENYLADAAVKIEKGPKYRALQPFERLEELQYGWPKSDNWRIARHMTREELEQTDLGKFLGTL